MSRTGAWILVSEGINYVSEAIDYVSEGINYVSEGINYVSEGIQNSPSAVDTCDNIRQLHHSCREAGR